MTGLLQLGEKKAFAFYFLTLFLTEFFVRIFILGSFNDKNLFETNGGDLLSITAVKV